MSERAGFDFVQKTFGKSLKKLSDYFTSEPFLGISNSWFTLYTSIFGSLDYYHLVSFPLSGIYDYNHPMYLDNVSDGNTFGFINSDLSISGKESHLVVANSFDINWCPCPDGNEDYPAWDGWPVSNNSLQPYPEDSGNNRMIIFLKGMFLKINSSINTAYNQTFSIDATKILSESLRQTDNYDIRVYRYDSATNDPSLGWIPSGNIYELNRVISGNNLIIQIGTSVGEDIPDNEPRFFMIYWQSPDDYCEVLLPTITTPNDVTSYLTFNDGDTPVSRELFDTNRYDLVDFKNIGNKYIKNFYTTRYDFIDGSSQHYDDENPIYYELPAMRGSLDPSYIGSYDPGTPGIGNIWGYGYSIDQGVNNPTEEDILQGIIICYKASAGEETDMQVISGPFVPPEFYPEDLKDFDWYPEVPEEYTLFAKIITKKISSEHEASYRPNSIIEYIEYIYCYGKDKIDNQLLFSYLYSYLLGNAFLINYLDTVLSSGLIPLIYMTPVTESRVSGMQYNAVYILNGEGIFDIFNTYWKIPVQHPITTTTAITTVESVHDYINQYFVYEYKQLEFNEYIRKTLAQNGDQQLSTILGSIYMDDNNSDFGIKTYQNKKIYIPKKLQIYMPIINSCHDYSELPMTKYDYTFRFNLRSPRQDTIRKDLFVSASKYYTTDEQAVGLVDKGLNPEEYLWPAKLNLMNEWVMYGRTELIPDLMGGENATIEMKQFKPRDTTLPLYDEFVADLQVQYYDELNSGDAVRVKNANTAIADAISDQEYLYGGFDNPDTRTLNNLIYSLDNFIISVSLYNSTGIPYWDTTIDFWGGNPNYYDSITGSSDIRYGFKLNNSWYYQSFIETDVAAERREYVLDHPEDYYILQEQDNDTGYPNNTFALNNTQYALATTFTADFADIYNKIYSVKLKLRLKNVPTAKLRLTINNTNIAKLPTDVIQTSDIIEYTSLSNSFEWIEFNFKNPKELIDGDRYSLVLSTESPNIGVDSINTIEWAFSNSDQHSYGITDKNSLLIIGASSGDTYLIVEDGSIYSSTPFYIKIGSEIFSVNSVVGNYLYLTGSLINDYDISTPVYEVTYVVADSEVRWYYKKDGEIYSWTPTTDKNYDATYQLYRQIDDIGLVTEVPNNEWSGTDISGSKSQVDAFYISSNTDSYQIPAIDDNFAPNFYGNLPGLNPIAGFNVPNSYDFPPVNTWRSGYTNLVDGVISWSSIEFDIPIQLSVFPLAIDNGGVVQYIPTKHDIYITVVCKKINNEKKVINKYIPAGTNSPVLLDAEYFIGIDLLWVDDKEFAESPFYGYGPSESFIIRSI